MQNAETWGVYFVEAVIGGQSYRVEASLYYRLMIAKRQALLGHNIPNQVPFDLNLRSAYPIFRHFRYLGYLIMRVTRNLNGVQIEYLLPMLGLMAIIGQAR